MSIYILLFLAATALIALLIEKLGSNTLLSHTNMDKLKMYLSQVCPDIDVDRLN